MGLPLMLQLAAAMLQVPLHKLRPGRNQIADCQEVTRYCHAAQFSGGRPEPAMAQYLEWHMSQVGAKDALLQQRLFAALSHLRQHAPPDSFQKASRYLQSLIEALPVTSCQAGRAQLVEVVHGL